jgi:hypothetical protein
MPDEATGCWPKPDTQSPQFPGYRLLIYLSVPDEPAPAEFPFRRFGSPLFGIAVFGIPLFVDPLTVVGSAGEPAGASEVLESPAVPLYAFPIAPPGAFPAELPMDPPMVEGDVTDPVLLPGAVVVPPPLV